MYLIEVVDVIVVSVMMKYQLHFDIWQQEEFSFVIVKRNKLNLKKNQKIWRKENSDGGEIGTGKLQKTNDVDFLPLFSKFSRIPRNGETF